MIDRWQARVEQERGTNTEHTNTAARLWRWRVRGTYCTVHRYIHTCTAVIFLRESLQYQPGLPMKKNTVHSQLPIYCTSGETNHETNTLLGRREIRMLFGSWRALPANAFICCFMVSSSLTDWETRARAPARLFLRLTYWDGPAVANKEYVGRRKRFDLECMPVLIVVLIVLLECPLRHSSVKRRPAKTCMRLYVF